MKHIKLSRKAAKYFLKQIEKDRQDRKIRMDEITPPKEIQEFMKNKTKEVDEYNGGTLNKSTFRLGMFCMWDYLKKHYDLSNNS